MKINQSMRCLALNNEKQCRRALATNTLREVECIVHSSMNLAPRGFNTLKFIRAMLMMKKPRKPFGFWNTFGKSTRRVELARRRRHCAACALSGSGMSRRDPNVHGADSSQSIISAKLSKERFLCVYRYSCRCAGMCKCSQTL